MARSSSDGFGQWVFAIDRRRHVLHGKTDMLNDLLARSDGSALTTLLYSASGIFVMCCCRISNTITRCERIYPLRRMRQYRALLRGQGTFFVARSWADSITDMPGFDLRQAQWESMQGTPAAASDLQRVPHPNAKLSAPSLPAG